MVLCHSIKIKDFCSVFTVIYENYNANESNCFLNCLTHSGPVTQQKSMNYAYIFVFARSVRRMRNSSVDRTWTVIACKWMCVEGGLCVILSSELFEKSVCYSWVGVRSLCVEYAWLCAGHASAVSAYASELVRNRARPRPSTDAPPS